MSPRLHSTEHVSLRRSLPTIFVPNTTRRSPALLTVPACHLQDFLEMLPLKEVTHPVAGPLNLAAQLPETAVKPDLGPKSFIAYGRCRPLNPVHMLPCTIQLASCAFM